VRHQVAVAVARLCGPDGAWRSPRTLAASRSHVSALLEWLAASRPDLTDLRDLRPSDWDSWVLHVGPRLSWNKYSRVNVTRQVLLRCGLDEATKKRLERRHARPQERGSTQSYEPAEFAAIAKAALKAVHAAELRITGNYALVQAVLAGRDIASKDHARAQALMRLWSGQDDLSSDELKALGAWARGRMRNPRYELFMTAQEAWACAVLLVCDNGWNASVLDRLDTPGTLAGEGEHFPIYTVDLVKPRRGRRRHSTSNLPDDAEDSAGRTVSRVLAATAPARALLASFGQPTSRLLIHLKLRQSPTSPEAFRLGLPATSTLRSSWLGPGLPPVTLRRLRQTHQTQVRKAPAQNSRAVHEDVYVRRDEIAIRESRKVAADGLRAALEAAQDTVLLRFLPEAETEPHVNDGSADTPVAACLNVNANPFTGGQCRDSFLLCLGCPNAVATPRHLPRLMALHAALAELASALPIDVWQTRWQEHFLRLSSLLELHTTEAERAAALRDATVEEKHNIDRLLRGELS
jgi:hypothetical protein